MHLCCHIYLVPSECCKIVYNRFRIHCFSFRTCFYALGLIGSTSIGADRLEELGWDSVRHKGTEEWPVIEPDITYILEPDVSEEEQVCI